VNKFLVFLVAVSPNEHEAELQNCAAGIVSAFTPQYLRANPPFIP